MKLMNRLFVFTLICTLFSCAKTERISIDVSEDTVIPKHYIISKASQEMKIDGKADEAAWENAMFSDLFVDIEGVKEVKYDTRMKMLWDDQYLYVYAKMQEPHIWGNLKQRDTVIFYNNDFEIFVDPSGTASNYVEFELNALNTLWDLRLNKPYRVGGSAQDDWNSDGTKTAVHIEGSLNNAEDKDLFWSVEWAIPLKDLAAEKHVNKNLPVDGEQWRINFSRVEWEFDLKDGKYARKKVDGKYLPEYNWVWSAQKVINMHEPEKWGVLQFTEKQSAKNVAYNADDAMPLKQAAYALFRKVRFGDLKSWLEASEESQKLIDLHYGEERSAEAKFEKTAKGFLITISEGKYEFVINEEGVLSI